jgi:hypothetical protein
MRQKLFYIVLMGMFLTFAGCRSTPIYNVSDAPVTTTGGKQSLADVEKAIIAAGNTLGWQMKPISSGNILGTLYLRDHMAQVDITYSRSSYSITYKDSNNLKYDGTNIHKNYNSWVQNLDKAIRAQFNNL